MPFLYCVYSSPLNFDEYAFDLRDSIRYAPEISSANPRNLPAARPDFFATPLRVLFVFQRPTSQISEFDGRHICCWVGSHYQSICEFFDKFVKRGFVDSILNAANKPVADFIRRVFQLVYRIQQFENNVKPEWKSKYDNQRRY